MKFDSNLQRKAVERLRMKRPLIHVPVIHRPHVRILLNKLSRSSSIRRCAPCKLAYVSGWSP